MDELEQKSIFVIRETFSRFKNPALLWSIGKDSTTLLWLCKKAFFNKIPFKVIHIDTGYKFKQMYEFRDRYAKEWDLDLLIVKKQSEETPEKSTFDCCNARKTQALKEAIIENKFDAILAGIRRDEHMVRNKERYFSPRDNDFKWNVVKFGETIETQDAEFSGWNLYFSEFNESSHVRVHPLLHWSEKDIWEYIEKENIPFVDLYLSKEGMRYRSLGCTPCTHPIKSNASNVREIITELETTKIPERTGRSQDKEYQMQKLRSLGYM